MSEEPRPAGAGWLTIEEAAAVLHVGVSTLRHWITQGKVPYKRLGRTTIRIPAAWCDPATARAAGEGGDDDGRMGEADA